MNNKFMYEALKEAKKAYGKGEVPIGAVIVKNGKVIAKAYNTKEKKQCCLKHAELIAIEKASKKLKNWRLDGCDIYITLEPCPMCASAIKQSRIVNIYYGLKNKDKKNLEIITKIVEKDNTNSSVNLNCGLLEKEVEALMVSFFKDRRNSK